jgi:hypothetical protein
MNEANFLLQCLLYAIKKYLWRFFRPSLKLDEPVLRNQYVFMFPRCDNDNKSIVPLEPEVITFLHSVAEANASDESEGVANQKDEQIGIF